MPLILRNVKGAELTWTELDNNFIYLENEIGNAVSIISGADVVRVTTQTFLPAQQAQARLNIDAASQTEVADIDLRLSDIEAYNFVLYDPQSPTTAQQQIARDNIDVYSKTEVNNLVGTVGGAQADWNATSGPSQILNLPSSFPPSSHTHAELGSVAYPSYNANTNLTANENRVFKFRSHIIGAGASNLFPISNTDANAVLDVVTKNHDEWHQLGFSSDGNLYHRVNSTSTKGTWNFLVNNSYLTSLGYQTASQVTTLVNNTLNNYGFAPNAFNYMHNATTIDTDDYREVIASYHNTSTNTATVLDANYDGVVLTIQAGNSQVDVAINVLSHNNPVTMFEVFADTAATFVWSDKLTSWIVRSTNKVY